MYAVRQQRPIMRMSLTQGSIPPPTERTCHVSPGMLLLLSPPKGKVLVSFSPPESPQVAGMMVWARGGQPPVWVRGTGRRHTLLSLGSKRSPQELMSSILDLPSLAAGVHQDPRLGSLRGGVDEESC